MAKDRTTSGSVKQENSIGWAKRYAKDRSWLIFPVFWPANGGCACAKKKRCGKNVGKHPIPRAGVKAATRNLTLIDRWWSRYPTANVARCHG